jgi:hypothetical protein
LGDPHPARGLVTCLDGQLELRGRLAQQFLRPFQAGLRVEALSADRQQLVSIEEARPPKLRTFVDQQDEITRGAPFKNQVERALAEIAEIGLDPKHEHRQYKQLDEEPGQAQQRQGGD